MKRIFFTLLITSWTQTYSFPSSINETEFIATHSVGKELEAILDQYSDALAHLVDKVHSSTHKKHGVWQFPWLPGYYIKYNIDRVYKRELLAECLETYALDLLHTPKKFLYHLKDRSHKLHSLNYLVICEEVIDDKDAYMIPMTLEQVEQYCKLIEETGHISTNTSNYLRLANGKLSFIDTDGTFNKRFFVRGIIDLLSCNMSTQYEPEALHYILEKVAYYFVRLNAEKKKYSKERIEGFLAKQHPKIAKEVRHQLEARINYHRELL